MKKFTLFALGLASCITVSAQDRQINPVLTNAANGTRTSNLTHHSSQSNLKGGYNAVNVAFSDAFDGDNSVTGLTTAGYTVIFNGTGTVGTTDTWFQGNPAVFAAYNGPDSGYVAANYNTVASGDIDNWLITPVINGVAVGDVISFYSQSVLNSTYPDSIRVMYSPTGALTATDPSWVELGRFKVNTTGAWLQSTYPVATAGATATFAIRYCVIDGGPAGVNSDYIGIDQLDVLTPATLDGGISAITAIPSNCAGLSATEAITVTISNFGASAISNFSVSYSINGGTPVVETYTGTINGGATASYTFTQTANLSAFGAYTITASTSITGDVNAGNDGSSTTTSSGGTSVTLGTPFSEGFESTAVGTAPPSGWTTEDTDGDGNSWDFTNAYPHNGTMCARVPFPTGAAAENWLFTPCLNLVAGTNYAIEYWYKSFDATMTSFQVETRFGSAPNSASMTNNIAVDPLFADSSYHMAAHAFTVPSSGTYHIGFNGFSAAASFSLRLDDALISVVTGVEENTLSNLVSVYPNPATDIINVTCKVKGDVNVEVLNAIGQVVYAANYSEPFKTQINLTKFAKGVYTVKFNNGNESLTKRIVLQN